ncbi:HalOD1 output domain-containing protein [Halosolutus amylolyticus]|uniref:HalOD1 output domain-containing protein n=1 Tax=Halosolutus amylolyticus TaxID=2932267 RepID=A0ABD5PS71_9EURY|nr:HalOD1 output domain-containing protein [Halosolutus amylolyticus]
MTESIDSTDDDIVTCRDLDTSRESPAIQIVDIVADLEDADPAEIDPIYNCVDGLIADLFSSPPPAAAEAELTFTYQGYRIHVQQDGTTTFCHAP